MKSYKCPECGAPLSKDSQMCDYCGAYIDFSNSNQQENEGQKASMDGLNEAVDSVKKLANKFNMENINWLLLIILCAACFPIGVIYFIFAALGDKK